MTRQLSVGDRVKPADSTVDHVGVIIAIRDSNYVIVQWQGSMRGTHHRSSLEYLNEASRLAAV